ncbi:uncharacterized protein LOC103510077 [Diaphorina citri]|uniref:Uncharacterized protein LOC103510077 n=1 Tax=Diaphorina citri TaxID=121845 RepID=A0A3Q0IUT4_DIACI|nr:uncharacterized protein LOC103510077 [Diaphorina citri]
MCDTYIIFLLERGRSRESRRSGKSKSDKMESSHYAWAVMAIVVTSTVESANILAIFPTASYSHQMPLLAVAKRLAERGHNLTVITPNPTKEPIPNYTDIDISFTYAFWTPQGDKKPVVNLQQRIGAFEMIGMFTQIAYTVVDLQLNSTPIQNFIKYVDREKPKFDLVIYEELMHTSFLALLPKIGHPPLVAMLTLALPCSIDFTFGNVCNPSYVPGCCAQVPIPNHTDIDISFSYSFWHTDDSKEALLSLQRRIDAFELLDQFTSITCTAVEFQLNSTAVQNFIK